MLFVKLAMVVDSWLWHSGMTGNRPELEFDYFGWLVVERARGMMENIVGGGESIAWCD
jgi:hypothetical protein